MRRVRRLVRLVVRVLGGLLGGGGIVLLAAPSADATEGTKPVPITCLLAKLRRSQRPSIYEYNRSEYDDSSGSDFSGSESDGDGV